MTINITMPALSPTMEEGNLAKWLVKEGDTVSAGDVIAEIETDKATMEVESIDEGTVGKIFVEEGAQGVKVNSVIAVLLEEGESADDISADAGALVLLLKRKKSQRPKNLTKSLTRQQMSSRKKNRQMSLRLSLTSLYRKKRWRTSVCLTACPSLGKGKQH